MVMIIKPDATAHFPEILLSTFLQGKPSGIIDQQTGSITSRTPSRESFASDQQYETALESQWTQLFANRKIFRQTLEGKTQIQGDQSISCFYQQLKEANAATYFSLLNACTFNLFRISKFLLTPPQSTITLVFDQKHDVECLHHIKLDRNHEGSITLRIINTYSKYFFLYQGCEDIHRLSYGGSIREVLILDFTQNAFAIEEIVINDQLLETEVEYYFIPTYNSGRSAYQVYFEFLTATRKNPWKPTEISAIEGDFSWEKMIVHLSFARYPMDQASAIASLHEVLRKRFNRRLQKLDTLVVIDIIDFMIQGIKTIDVRPEQLCGLNLVLPKLNTLANILGTMNQSLLQNIAFLLNVAIANTLLPSVNLNKSDILPPILEEITKTFKINSLDLKKILLSVLWNRILHITLANKPVLYQKLNNVYTSHNYPTMFWNRHPDIVPLIPFIEMEKLKHCILKKTLEQSIPLDNPQNAFIEALKTATKKLYPRITDQDIFFIT